MSPQRARLAEGGRIDRGRPLGFRFDGRPLQGHAGDTLASALLANGVTLVGRSFKYHRPRGILSAGPEEPNALVQLGEGGRTEPNLRATQIELYDGLVAESQNRWPSLDVDFGSVNNLLAPLFPAGFYYKTFMWPRSLWMTYEYFIRRMAGLGRAPASPDPDRYERAAVRWLGRFALEARGVTIEDLRTAAAALAVLPGRAEEAMERLQRLCVERGVG